MLSNIVADMGATVAASAQAPAPKAVEPAAAAPAVPVAAPVEQSDAPRADVPMRINRTRKPATRQPGQGTLRERTKQLSLYLEEPVYDALREIAHVERSKMHQLVVEGIDLLLKKRGAPSITELLKRAG